MIRLLAGLFIDFINLVGALHFGELEVGLVEVALILSGLASRLEFVVSLQGQLECVHLLLSVELVEGLVYLLIGFILG